MNTGQPIYNELQCFINKKGDKVASIVTNIPIEYNNEIVGVIEFAQDIKRVERIYTSIDNWLANSNFNKVLHTHDRINKYSFDDFITCNNDLIKLIEKVKKMSAFGSNILIYGETGTGKEIFAQSIHNASKRKNMPFIAQNCAAIPENLLESILFGTERGGFTGALDKEGLFEQAHKGTLLLDELNSLPIYLQAKLLRVLQDGYIRRIGSNKDKKVDVRVIASINEEPGKLLEEGKLREDLFYRLNALYIKILPLRERKEDIYLISNHYLKRYCDSLGRKMPRFSKEVKEIFDQYDWKGNVRELINVIEYIVMSMEDDEVIRVRNLPEYMINKIKLNNFNNSDSETYHQKIMNYERELINDALIKNKWNISRTAKMLNIKRQTLQNKMNRIGIKTK